MTLGRITVDLLAKTGSFETDINRSAKLAERRAKEIDREFKRIGKAIGLALVAAGTAITATIKSSIDRMDEMSKAAQRVQMPTEQFSALVYAGDLADVSMEDLTKTLGKLAKAQGDAARGLETQSRAFKDLGIDAIDPLTGRLRSTTDVFLEFADAFQKHQGSPEIMALGMEIFGRSFQKLIPLLKDGRKGLEDAANEAERLGIIVSTEAGRAAEQFNDDLTRLKTAAQGVAQQIAAEMLPRLTQLAEGFLDSATEGEGLASTAREIGRSFSDAIAGVANFYDRLVILRAEMVKLQTAGQNINPSMYIRSFFDGGEFAKEMQAKAEQATKDIAAAEARIAGRAQVPVRLIRGTAPVGGATPPDIRKTPKAKSGGKSDAEKEAEKLLQQYERLESSLREQIALHGETTEVAKLRYELENGELAKLSQAQKDTLLGLAQQRDEQIAATKLAEEGKRLTESLLTPTEELNKLREEANDLLEKGAISQETYNRALEAYKTPAERMLEDLQHEFELLGKTREEQERLNAARWLGVEAATEQGRAALAALEAYQRQEKAVSQQIEAMDGLRDSARGLLYDLKEGVGVWDALKNAADRFADVLFKIAADNLIEKLFGQQGSAQTGAVGGNFWSGLLGAFFGGGREHGGPVGKGGTYLVGERGPELFVPGTAGTIVPAGQTAQLAGANGAPMVVNFQLPSMVTRQTEVQAQQRLAQASQRATRRNS